MEEKSTRLTRSIGHLTGILGSFPAIIGSILLIVIWGMTGPIFGFSDTWQLIINTGTTIVTFNMVFIIQNTQNRDGRAIQTKLDAQSDALADVMSHLGMAEKNLRNLVGVEDAPEKVIKAEQQQIREKVNKKKET